MIDGVRKRLTYANVMATLAVFLALGGGAYAAIDLVGRNDIKSKHIDNGQVKDRDLAGPTYWAVVDGVDGNLARSGQGGTSSDRTEEGTYEVDFGRDIRNCAYVATTGRSGQGGTAAAGAIDLVRAAGTTDTVFVETEDLGAIAEDRSFHLAVHC